jgi:hypothetical protein
MYSRESTRVTVEIVPLGSGCELTLTHDRVLPEYRARTESGWKGILDALAAALDQGPGAGQAPGHGHS